MLVPSSLSSYNGEEIGEEEEGSVWPEPFSWICSQISLTLKQINVKFSKLLISAGKQHLRIELLEKLASLFLP